MPLTRRDFVGATVVLTGAASGMGEQMARQLAAEGARTLVLVDRDVEHLAEVAADLWASQGTNAALGSATTVETHVVDLADRTATIALAETILGAHPRIDLLVNNAGVALMGRFDEVSVEDVEWVLAINLRAPIILTRLLLPALKAAEGSHVINLSSLFGLIAPPGQVAYSTSKFGLRGFSEGIGVELNATASASPPSTPAASRHASPAARAPPTRSVSTRWSAAGRSPTACSAWTRPRPPR